MFLRGNPLKHQPFKTLMISRVHQLISLFTQDWDSEDHWPLRSALARYIYSFLASCTEMTSWTDRITLAEWQPELEFQKFRCVQLLMCVATELMNYRCSSRNMRVRWIGNLRSNLDQTNLDLRSNNSRGWTSEQASSCGSRINMRCGCVVLSWPQS